MSVDADQSAASPESDKSDPVLASEEVPETDWIVLLIEDDDRVRCDIREEFAGELIAGRKFSFRIIATFEEAFREVRQRRADLVILDVYRGSPLAGGEPAGFEVLASLREAGFSSVILYTADPESARRFATPLVRVVGKDEGGVGRLREEVEDLFSTHLPQIFRAVVGHLDRTLRDYMWGFVEKNWTLLEVIRDRPEFLRLLLARLAASLSQEGIERITTEVFGIPDPMQPGSGRIHPAEYYIMPPVGRDVRFGDIRIASAEDVGKSEYRVVVWPTCDMVTAGGRVVKAERVACARATPLSDTEEMKAWKKTPSKATRAAIRKIMENKRQGTGLSPDRFHYLPAFCQVLDLVVDFQRVDSIPFPQVSAMECQATVASPFAEALAARYLHYIGRIGTPDLDVDGLLQRVAPASSGGAGGV